MSTEKPNIVSAPKWRSLLVYFFGFLIFLPFASLLILQNQSIQQKLSRKIATHFAHQTGMQVEFEKVRYTFFHKLVIKNLLLADSLHDTLLFAPELTVDLKAAFFRRNQLVFNQVQLNNARILIKKESDGRLNWQKVFAATAPTDTSLSKEVRGWSYKFRNVILENADVQLVDVFDSIQLAEWRYARFSGLVLRVKNLSIGKNTFEGRINRLGFQAHNGFHLLNLSTDFSYTKGVSLGISRLSLVTPNSDIDIKQLSFDLTDNLPFNQLPVVCLLNLSKISLSDLGYFIPRWRVQKLTMRISGEAKGSLSDLRIKNLSVIANGDNYFKGSIHYTRISDNIEPYLYFDVKDMRATMDEIQKVANAFKADSVLLPEVVKRMDHFYFKGNFTGFPSDFVAFGTLRSPMGTLKLDVSLKPSSKQNIGYNGSLEAIQFKIGELLGKSELIGSTNLTLTAQGNLVNGNEPNGTITLDIHNTSINGYPLHNLGARGTIANKVFQGTATIEDPNLQIETTGYYSLSDSFPKFNFTANVRKVNLFAFHILSDDSIQHMQAKLEANFVGNSINEFDGNINIDNIVLINKHDELHIKDIAIQAFNNKRTQATIVSSQLFDMQIQGEYQFKTMVDGFKHILKNYIPSISIDNQAVAGNNFTFTIHLKHAQPIFNFFYPSVKLADSSLVTGVFKPATGQVELNATANYLQISSWHFESPVLKVQTDDSALWVKLITPSLIAGTQLPFAQLAYTLNLNRHDAKFSVTWFDSLAHVNELRFRADSFRFIDNMPLAHLTIEPSQIFIRGKPWNLLGSSVVLDTQAIDVNHFQLKHQEKEINIMGRISNKPEDSLHIAFQNLDLNILNYLLQTKSFLFAGRLDGTITMKNLFQHRNITGHLEARSLEVNGTELGNMQIVALWQPEGEAIDIRLSSIDSASRLMAKGLVFPMRRSYQFDVYFNRVGLKMIEPIISPTFLINNGLFSGYLRITDENAKPVLDGKLEINDAVIYLTQLHTSYRFTNTLVLERNNFVFKDFVLYDETKRPIRLNGQLRNKYLKNFKIDFTLLADDNLVFNKPAPDDLPFYGKAFASGNIHVYNNDDYIVVDVTQGKTEDNSLILVSLGQNYYSGSNDFIQFVPSEKGKRQSIAKENISVAEPKRSRLLLNMDLDVTPQAEIQLLFSANRGDMLRGRGRGSLKFEVDKAGNFFIRGQYSLTEGMYNFTMNNLMNKKFDIQSNSTIFFNGSPTDANVDITAVYHTRAPLYNLFAESNMEYRQRIPVDCQLFLTGRLLEPDIRFSIDLPNATEETKSRVRSIISSEQAMSQQFLALLLLNNFMPVTTGNLQTKLQESNLGVDVAATTSMELLSSQLSSWLSSLNKDLNFGISYRPGDQVYSNEDLEIALSTQLLNNRMIINSSIDIIGQSNTNNAARQSSTLLGDVNVEYRLTERLSLKAFNRSNDILYFQDDIYTRGIGIIYRQEFSNLKELTRRYYRQKQKEADSVTAK